MSSADSRYRFMVSEEDDDSNNRLGYPPGEYEARTWPTKTERLPGVGTSQQGVFERVPYQINHKIISGPLEGEHVYWDPRSGRSGYAGHQRDNEQTAQEDDPYYP